jgi:hypothetical protein
MSDDMIWHRFAPGEEPTALTANLCTDKGCDLCSGWATDVAGHEGKTVWCICLCHRAVEGRPN